MATTDVSALVDVPECYDFLNGVVPEEPDLGESAPPTLDPLIVSAHESFSFRKAGLL